MSAHTVINEVTTAAALAHLRNVPGVIAVQTMRSWAKRGVRETSHNSGRWVDAIIAMGGGDIDDDPAWCAYGASAAWLIAADALGVRLDFQTGGGVVKMWHANPSHRIALDDVRTGRVELAVGDIYLRARKADEVRDVLAGGSALGHCGLVVGARASGVLHTVECNTDSGDSRDGDGVYDKSTGITVDDGRLIGFVRPRVVAL